LPRRQPQPHPPPDDNPADASRHVEIRTTTASGLTRGLLCLAWLAAATTAVAADWQFELRFEHAVHAGPYTGRVYLFFSEKLQPEPRLGPNWFSPAPFAALDVTAWKPGAPLRIAAGTDSLRAFPQPLGELPLQNLYVQAVARFNDWERAVGNGSGNGFSTVVKLPETPADEPLRLTIDQLVPERRFEENQWNKLLAVRSERLSTFHERAVFVRAAVLLPKSYHDQPERRFPVIFNVPGFGGTLFFGRRNEPADEQNADDVEFVRVTLDPNCPWGHHVFADSETNGPWSTALLSEWLPEFERQFRVIAAPHGRLLTGHSSGGWSTLWLQISHPGVFGGVWSTAPDPVDFRDFQQIDIYRDGENAYRDPQGQRRPIARRGGNQVAIWFDDFDRMEQVLGHGGQFESFEAVFSPRGSDGRPMPLWSRTTGSIDPRAAKAWERYDIRLVLERRWPELAPQLAGKLHVFMGEHDTFYLDGAVRLLRESLLHLGSDAVIEIHPGKDHGSLLTRELRDRIRREMAETVLRAGQP
jgi:S-formylglutathione hydrolase FrmB